MGYIEFKRGRGKDKKKRNRRKSNSATQSVDKKFPTKRLAATGMAGLGIVGLARSKNYNPGALIQKGSKWVSKNVAKGAAEGAAEGAVEGALGGAAKGIGNSARQAFGAVKNSTIQATGNVKRSAKQATSVVKDYYNLPKKVKQAKRNYKAELTSRAKPSGSAAKTGKKVARIIKKFRPQTN